MRILRFSPALVAALSSAAVLFALYPSAGATQFINASPTVVTNPQSSTIGPVLGTADFNGDGRADILTTSGSVFSVLLANSNGTFTQKVSTITAQTTVKIADVNGDGKADLVVVQPSQAYCFPSDSGTVCEDENPAYIAIELGKGDGTFTSLTPIKLSVEGGDVPTLLVTDLNGDGKPDIAVTIGDNILEGNVANDPVLTLLNTGGGNFTAVAQSTASGQLLAAGDFNGDGKTDLVLGPTLKIANGVGNGTFTAGASYSQIWAALAVAADFNRDGRLDLVVSRGTQGRAELLTGNGKGGFTVSQLLNSFIFGPGSVQNAPVAIASADFNHDGYADLLFSYGEFGAIFTNQKNGTFSSPRTYNLGYFIYNPGPTTSPLGLGDFNGDGNLDIVQARSNGTAAEPFNIAYGDKYGSFGAPVITQSAVPFQDLQRAIASGDFNGDGKPDIAEFVAPSCSTCKSSVAVYLGAGQGVLGAGEAYPVDTLNGTITVGDVNNDGKLDIVVARTAFPENPKTPGDDISVLLGNGDGTFQPAISRQLLGNAHYGTTNPHTFLVDVNHDGKLDFVGDWGVALGHGDGTFAAPIRLPSSFLSISDMAVGDLNKDGNVDLIVSQSGSFGGDAVNTILYTLLGDGKGNFTVSNQNASSQVDENVAIVLKDLNGDGNLDLAYTGIKYVNGAYTSGVIVEFGKGDGTFASGSFYAEPILNSAELLADDFNGDGYPDLLTVTSTPQGDFALLPGSVNGEFSAPVQYYQGEVSAAVAVDLTGDGMLDVAGTTPIGISRLLNTGVKQ